MSLLTVGVVKIKMVRVYIAKMYLLCKNTLHHLWPQRYLITGFAIGYYTVYKIPVTGEPVNKHCFSYLFLYMLTNLEEAKARSGRLLYTMITLIFYFHFYSIFASRTT